MENVDDPNKGIIIIEDDGFGMSPEIVENVWFEPGADFKSLLVKTNQVPNTIGYQSRKGIGRFSFTN